MSEDQPAEETSVEDKVRKQERYAQMGQGVAQFLEANDIAVFNVLTEDVEVLTFQQYSPGDHRMIGQLSYDRKRGALVDPPIEEHKRRLAIQGFLNTVIRPLGRMLRHAQNGYDDEIFNAVDEASDRVIMKYSP
ncbi:MAG: hypothetical protein KJ709_05245 [Nanoarchaeota archaeon]|nr:hypothetical protein [Nanoarchaeota archaeon]